MEIKCSFIHNIRVLRLAVWKLYSYSFQYSGEIKYMQHLLCDKYI